MEDGRDTRYWQGPKGRVPWMKLQEAPARKQALEPDIKTASLSSRLRLRYELSKRALLSLFRDD